jgi:hypothetical protein
MPSPYRQPGGGLPVSLRSGQSVTPTGNPLHYERMFDIVRPVHFEVDVEIQHPLDVQAKRFLTDVQRSANRVLRFRGDDRRIIVTVEAHAYDRGGAVSAAIREVAHIYPLVTIQLLGEPRQL